MLMANYSNNFIIVPQKVSINFGKNEVNYQSDGIGAKGAHSNYGFQLRLYDLINLEVCNY